MFLGSVISVVIILMLAKYLFFSILYAQPVGLRFSLSPLVDKDGSYSFRHPVFIQLKVEVIQLNVGQER